MSAKYSFKPGKTTISIVPGRLYSYKNTIVRARQRCRNGLRHVSFHRLLNGFVRDSELELISKQEVEEYLKEA